MAKKEAPEEMSYETALSKLEDIVEHLERGDVPLDESLKKFSEGIRLSRFLSDKLKKAEEEIKKLVEQENGTMGTELLDVAGGD
ncbi:MAG: exodeoxyribonuclease VII small subunit [bacterium]